MAHADSAPLIALADRIAREAPCAQGRDIRALGALRNKLINAHKVPAALQDPFSSGVNQLSALAPPCLPVVPAATATPASTTAPKHGKGAHHHGKGEGKGKD